MQIALTKKLATAMGVTPATVHEIIDPLFCWTANWINRIIYTYDMGDNWEHEIKLVRIIDEHDDESPYLLEANGQTPPEDVGGVGGFIRFHEIMLNPQHPEYSETKEWAGYWTPELGAWSARPRVVD